VANIDSGLVLLAGIRYWLSAYCYLHWTWDCHCPTSRQPYQ